MNVALPLDLLDQLKKLKSFSLGYSGLIFYPESGMSEGQIGYSIDHSGMSLIGESDGDWKKSWVAIGYEEAMGDPIFIDLSVAKYPVYSAIHGEGDWDPDQISVSLEEFAKATEELRLLSKGREYPVALENNPVSDAEIKAFLRKIKVPGSESIDFLFWENFFET